MSDTRHLLGGVVIVPEALRADWIAGNLAAETRFAAARAGDSERPAVAEHSRETDLAPAAFMAACACGPTCGCSTSTQSAAA